MDEFQLFLETKLIRGKVKAKVVKHGEFDLAKALDLEEHDDRWDVARLQRDLDREGDHAKI